ncbi:hypothetical protein VR610_10360 [Aquirufa regiilacus]
MKNLIISITLVLLCINPIIAQETEKIVSITVSGSGKTQDEAKQVALRSAIEQAFGAFISSKTEVFNDQVVADQMASISSGNIQSYSILNESQLPNGAWGITLKASVSVNKLTSFVQAKGIAIEIKGGLFATNIKQQILNEQGEYNSLLNVLGIMHNIMQDSFDFTVKSSEPTAVSQSSQNWEVDLTVKSKPNQNFFTAMEFFTKTLLSISVTNNELMQLNNQKRFVKHIDYTFQGKRYDIILRNEKSIWLLQRFIKNFTFYQSNFDLLAKFNNGVIKIEKDNDYSNSEDIIGLCPIDQYYKCGIKIFGKNYLKLYSIKKIFQLSQIENLNEFSIKSRGKVIPYQNGGYSFKNNNSILTSSFVQIRLKDIPGIAEFEIDSDIQNAINLIRSKIRNLNLFGYSNWRLPTQNELLSLNYKFKDAPLYSGLDDNGREELFIVSDKESPIDLEKLRSGGTSEYRNWGAENCFIVLVKNN